MVQDPIANGHKIFETRWKDGTDQKVVMVPLEKPSEMDCDLEYKAGAPHATTSWDDRDVVARAAQQEGLHETLRQHQGNIKLLGTLLSGVPQRVPTVSRLAFGASNPLSVENSGQDDSQATGFAGKPAVMDLLLVDAEQTGNGPCWRAKPAAAPSAGASSGKASVSKVDMDSGAEACVTRAEKVFEDFHRGQLLGAGQNLFKTVQYLRWGLENRQHQVSPLIRNRVQEGLKRLRAVVTVTKAFNAWYKSRGLSSCCCWGVASEGCCCFSVV